MIWTPLFNVPCDLLQEQQTSVATTSGRASAGDEVLATWCRVVTSVIVVCGALQREGRAKPFAIAC